MSGKDIQPIFIMPEGTQRSYGKAAQRNNIMAAKLVAETVRTTLGPKGMDKMIVGPLGEITITNDGVTILEEMQIEHPAAKMLVEVAKTQEDEVGDGTTTAVVLAGELLKNAELLLEKNIHPTIIAKGYRIAEEVTQKILLNLSENITEKDINLLKQIAITAMTGKGAEHAKERLAELTVRAVIQIMEKEGRKINIDSNNIKIEKKIGGSVDDSAIIEGVVLDKEKVHSDMPRLVRNAKIALLDAAIEIKNTEIESKIQITTPDQIQQFIDVEEQMIRDMVTKVIRSGANVVFCQKGIDDLAQHYLSKNGIYACRRVKKSDIDQLAKATGAKIVMNLDDLSPADLGHAGIVEEKRFGNENMTYIEECDNTKSITLLIRGGTEHIVAEIERAVDDAVGDLAAALVSGKIVAGAGATETEVARNLRLYATSLSGREQLAVLAFADSIEIIPRTLAENAGLDPIDVLTDLKVAHDKGQKWAGIDVFSGKVIDAWKTGVIEPLKIKTQAISSASEVAEMLLRIDDVIAGGAQRQQGMPQMPPDMGGMM